MQDKTVHEVTCRCSYVFRRSGSKAQFSTSVSVLGFAQTAGGESCEGLAAFDQIDLTFLSGVWGLSVWLSRIKFGRGLAGWVEARRRTALAVKQYLWRFGFWCTRISAYKPWLSRHMYVVLCISMYDLKCSATQKTIHTCPGLGGLG